MTATNAIGTSAQAMHRAGVAPRNNATPRPTVQRRQPLGYPLRPFLISLILLPLLIAPYVLIVYIWLRLPQNDRQFMVQSDLDRIRDWTFIARIIEIFAALLSLPLISSMLAHVAVIQSQRLRKTDSLSLNQLMSLADRSWMSFGPLFTPKGKPMVTWFGFLSCFIVFLSFVNIPIRTGLLQQQPRFVGFCEGRSYYRHPLDESKRWNPDCEPYLRRWEAQPSSGETTHGPYTGTGNVVAQELSPAYPTRWEYSTGGVIDNIVGALQTIEPLSWQSSRNLWFASPESDASEETVAANSTDTWLSAVPRDASLGILRLHSVGLTSTARCQLIERREFPEVCLEPGQHSFFVSNFTTDDMDLRACIPESNPPEFKPHRDRQTMNESLYLSLWVESEAALGIIDRDEDEDNWRSEAGRSDILVADGRYNKTIRCDAETTIGYFELPSKHNDYRASSILREWPSPDEMNNFDDFDEDEKPMVRDIPLENDYGYFRQGPLRGAAEALFGPASFFHRIARLHQVDDGNMPRELLVLDPIPFYAMNFDVSDYYDYFQYLTSSWRTYPFEDLSRQETYPYVAYGLMAGFSDPAIGDRALHTALFLANQASLTDDRASPYNFRPIYEKRQISAYLPSISLPVLIVLGILVLIQVLIVLGFLVIVRVIPTWTNTLDAYAMLRVGAHLKSLPPLGRSVTKAADQDKVRSLEGLIGLESDGDTDDIELAPVPADRRRSGASSPTLEEQQQHQTQPQLRTEPPGPPAPSYESTIATEGEGSTPPPLHRRVGVEDDDDIRSSSPPPEYSRRQTVIPSPYHLSIGGKGLISRKLWRKFKYGSLPRRDESN